MAAPDLAVDSKKAPAPAPAPYGWEVMESKKISTAGGVFSFHAGKILLLRAYGPDGIKRLRSAGLKLKIVQDEPEL